MVQLPAGDLIRMRILSAVGTTTVRVALIDDHPLVLDGLVAGLLSIDSVEVVAVGGTAGVAADVLRRPDIDVVLLDVRLQDGNGLQVLSERAQRVRPFVLILSSFDSSQYVAAASRLGASGFLLKTTPLAELVRAVHTVAKGGTVFTAAQLRTPLVTLTARERDVIALIIDGLTNKEIGDHLHISQRAVEQHLSELFFRQEIHGGRVELALRAATEGWLEIDAPSTRRERQKPVRHAD